MGRPREFDTEVVLERAMELFWRQGYEATSMSELVATTGVGRQSLYGAFGDKAALYQQALRRYCRVQGDLLAPLAEASPVLPAVRAVFRAVADSAAEDCRGCFVVNASVERLPGDEATLSAVAGQLARLEEILATALTRARAGGELGPAADPAALARFLVTTLQGLQVMAKARPAAGVLRDSVETALQVLAVHAAVRDT